MARLTDPTYLSFPFALGAGGPKTVRRQEHVREQIEQVLFTVPGERVFRHEFGAGVKRLVFEPYTDALREITHKRLSAALTDVLRGEVDPKTLQIEVGPAPDAGAVLSEQRLVITVSYRLATINSNETQTLVVSAEDIGG